MNRTTNGVTIAEGGRGAALGRHLITLVAIALVMAPVAFAQEPAAATGTHTVKRGDTLWDLAQQYLGNPFQWPQIYQLNTDLIKDPHWIYPGQVLKLPGGAAGAAAPAEPAPQAPAMPQAEPRGTGMTVFNPANRRVERRSREAIVLGAPRTAVRPGEYESSPFLWADGGLMGGGRLEGTVEPINIALTPEFRPIQIREEVLVMMPAGVEAVAGQELLTFRNGPLLAGNGQVIVPTGVVRVTGPAPGGRARAIVVRKFEDVFAGNGVIPNDTLSMPANVFPSRVEFGISTRVLWVHTAPALVASGVKLIVAATAAQGLVPGDQLSLRARRPGDVAGVLTDAEIGVAQVTRVTPWGASAVVLGVLDAGVAAGTRAQVSAKMP